MLFVTVIEPGGVHAVVAPFAEQVPTVFRLCW